jgi:hypothetical protein
VFCGGGPKNIAAGAQRAPAAIYEGRKLAKTKTNKLNSFLYELKRRGGLYLFKKKKKNNFVTRPVTKAGVKCVKCVCVIHLPVCSYTTLDKSARCITCKCRTHADLI